MRARQAVGTGMLWGNEGERSVLRRAELLIGSGGLRHDGSSRLAARGSTSCSLRRGDDRPKKAKVMQLAAAKNHPPPPEDEYLAVIRVAQKRPLSLCGGAWWKSS